jgi:hypothetical protein
MTIKISEVFHGLNTQQLTALINILNKADAHAKETGADQGELLDARITEDMHPLSWQIQTSLELLVRGGARLVGLEPGSVSLEEREFSKLVPRVKEIQAQLTKMDSNVLDQIGDKIFEIPAGPDTIISLSGNDYVLKFLLPNFYFHLSTAYDILRMRGVPLSKRDFLGPITT